jgi:uncharacterized protein (DUF1697 family)
MKYVALLRGINVGGKNIIKMAELKKAVEECGFSDVRTYIQSGNIIYESGENNKEKVSNKLEACLLRHFTYDLHVVIRNEEQMKKIISDIPCDWGKCKDLRCYIAFIREPVSEQDVLCEVELKEGIDSIKTGHGVLYMSTLLTGLTQSRFTRLISKKIYKDITIRNYSTVKNLVSLMASSNS